MTITVKKLWQGFASVRSTTLLRCVNKKEDLVIFYATKKMTIPFKHLLNPLQLNKHEQKSKYQGTYTLYDFLWLPDEGKGNLLPLEDVERKRSHYEKEIFYGISI